MLVKHGEGLSLNHAIIVQNSSKNIKVLTSERGKFGGLSYCVRFHKFQLLDLTPGAGVELTNLSTFAQPATMIMLYAFVSFVAPLISNLLRTLGPYYYYYYYCCIIIIL